MPFQYARDDARRRITMTASDPLTMGERIAVLEHQLADDAWTYGVIIDARSMAPFRPKLTEMQAVTSRLAELVAVHGPRGPVAIVSRQTSVITASCLHNSMGVRTPIEVFWQLDDAQTYLDGSVASDPDAPSLSGPAPGRAPDRGPRKIRARLTPS
jgi:hypothetical protein